MFAQLIALLRAFWYWIAVAVLCLTLLLLASWKWFFVFAVTFTVFYLGLSALLGKQRLSNMPARIVVGFALLFIFTKLAYECSRWLLWHEPSEMLSSAWCTVMSAFHSLPSLGFTGGWAGDDQYSLARLVLLLIAVVGIVKLLLRKS